jgi:hypothetical protein
LQSIESQSIHFTTKPRRTLARASTGCHHSLSGAAFEIDSSSSSCGRERSIIARSSRKQSETAGAAGFIELPRLGGEALRGFSFHDASGILCLKVAISYRRSELSDVLRSKRVALTCSAIALFRYSTTDWMNPSVIAAWSGRRNLSGRSIISFTAN